MLDWRWVCFSLVDGHVIGEVPKLIVPSIEHRMTEYTTATAQLPWDGIPDNFMDYIRVGASCMCLVDEDDEPLWAGMVNNEERALGADSISLGLITLDGYMDRCHIGNHHYQNVAQTEIARDLVQRFCIDGRSNCLRVQVDADSSQLRTRDYLLSDNNYIYELLQNLSNVQNGIEWLMEIRHGGDGYYPLLRIADHIGATSPQASFDIDMIRDFKVKTDGTKEHCANNIMATSTADGGQATLSSWHRFSDINRPVLDYSWTPNSGITDLRTLDAYAQAKLDAVKLGTRTVDFDLDFPNAPKPGLDWHIGDVVDWDCSMAVERYPDAYTGSARVVGWKLDLNTLTLTPYTNLSGE